jgi:DNA-binding MarR family transcriptional regulator
MSARKLRLYHALQLAAHGLQKIADREIAAQTDLTTAQAAVLSVIANGEGDTQREVAKALGVNESAVAAMVERLLRLGYLARRRSNVDARAWTLSIRAKGIAALTATKAPFKRVNAMLERELAPHELENLAAYLERLVAACELTRK